MTILDARGETAAGKKWRYLGRFSESATYHGADGGTAELHDRILDGACIPQSAQR